MSKTKYELKPHPEYGFLQIYPSPSTEEITKFYTDEFYSAHTNFNDSDLEVQTEDRDWLNEQRGEICLSIKEFLARDLAGLDMLDVGCGWGENLLYFQKQGMNCFGFDPAPEAAAYAQKIGLNVVTAGMDKMTVFGERQFDVVSLFNVLEHLADPVGVLKEIRNNVLKPGGLIIIDVPNEFNAFQECAKDIYNLSQWWVVPPSHLNYFSGDSLKALLRGTGFDVKLCEASFPMEIFLLLGDKYVGDGPLGKICHQKRKAFESNLRKTGRSKKLREFYVALAELNLGRQVIAYALNN